MTDRELFIHRTLEGFPCWTHKRSTAGKRHAYAAPGATASLCGTVHRAKDTRTSDDVLQNVTCKLCRAKVIADLHGLLAILFRSLKTSPGETLDAELAIEADWIEENSFVPHAPILLRRLACLSEETRKWIAEQERLRRAARHARHGTTIIHETTL